VTKNQLYFYEAAKLIKSTTRLACQKWK